MTLQSISSEEHPWRRITKLSCLEVVPSSTMPMLIYANGCHQAAVHVLIRGVGDDDVPIDVSVEEIMAHMELVDYVSGRRLGGVDSADWAFSGNSNHYPVVGEAGSLGFGEASVVTFYVTASPGVTFKSLRIGAAITLANGERYSTSIGGTYGFSSCVLVQTKRAIDYGDPLAWRISVEGYRLITGDVNCRYYVRSKIISHWENEFDGVSRWRKFTYQYKELPIDHEIRVVVNPPAFDEIRSMHRGGSCSLRFRSAANGYAAWNHDGNFNINIWFINPSGEVGLRADGVVGLHDAWRADREIVIGPNDNRHREDADPYQRDRFKLYQWNLLVPHQGIEQRNWNNETGVRDVAIYDQYGNTGVLKMRFTYDSDLPYLDG